MEEHALHKQNKRRKWTPKNAKLTSKLALAIGAALVVIFAILIVVTVTLTGAGVQRGVSGELSAIAKSNGNEIQSCFDLVEETAKGVQDYIDRAYQGQGGGQTGMESTLYAGQQLTLTSYNMEQFMLSTVRNAVQNNEELKGLGVMFEPYQFQRDMPEYGFYLSTESLSSPLGPYPYDSYSKEDSYHFPVEEGSIYISQPYQDGDSLVVAYGTPIQHDGKVLGVVIASVDLNAFSAVKTSTENYADMWATLFDGQGAIVWDSRSLDLVGQQLTDTVAKDKQVAEIQQAMARGEAFHLEQNQTDGPKITCFYSPLTAGGETWWSVTALTNADAHAAERRTTTFLLVLSVAALAFIVCVVTVVLRRLLAPIQTIVGAADQLAKGNLEIQLDREGEDEIAQLANSFQTMAETLRAIIQDINRQLGEMSSGNFCIASQEEARYVGEYRGIFLSIQRINRTLSQTLRQINTVADAVSAGAAQSSDGAQALAEGSAEQTSSIQYLAANTSQVLEHVRATPTMPGRQRKAKLASKDLSESDEKLQETLAMMTELQNSSQEISKILQTIEDIAFQTNILALNAAVEAARAGEAGKGFSVVAEEVRNLAQKSSEASQNTANLIRQSLSAIQRGTGSMRETADYMSDVLQRAQEITVSIQQISEASDQQTAALEQINQGVDEISGVVQTNSASAEESAAASEELSEQSRQLRELVARFRLREEEEEVRGTGAYPS